MTTDPLPHLWWALGTTGPLTRTVLDSALVYDVIRGNAPGDLFTAEEPETTLHRRRGTRAGEAADRLVHPPRDPRGAAGQRSTSPPWRRPPGCWPASGTTCAEVDPHYPDPTAAFVPQFFAGVRAEADAVEHFDRLEPRTRQVYRLGVLGDGGRGRVGAAAGATVAERANRVFDERRRAAHPDDRAPAAARSGCSTAAGRCGGAESPRR